MPDRRKGAGGDDHGPNARVKREEAGPNDNERQGLAQR